MSFHIPAVSKSHLWPQQVLVGLKDVEVNTFQQCILGRKAVTPVKLMCPSGQGS